jgi:hypothetical protein
MNARFAALAAARAITLKLARLLPARRAPSITILRMRLAGSR